MMAHDDLVRALTSGGFALTCTAVLRKLCPAVDGKWVLLMVLLLSSVASLVTTYAGVIPGWAWEIIRAIVGATTVVGATEWTDRLALKITRVI
jgi:hypothetical protein